MISKEYLEKLSHRLSAILPAAGQVRRDFEKQCFDLLQNSLGKLNVVTREEFDAQLKVLHRAEQSISELEAKVSELEARSAQQ